MPKVRQKDFLHNPPPEYDPSKNELSLFVHYGGSVSNGPSIQYVGGSLYVFDYVEVEYVNFGCITSLCEDIGVFGSVRLYTNSEKGLQKIRSEKMLTELCLECLKGSREFHLFVDLEIECLGSDPVSPKDIGDTHLGSGGFKYDVNEEGEESEEGEDSLFHESDYAAGENVADDVIFQNYADNNAEWEGIKTVEVDNRPNDELIDELGEEDIVLSEEELRSEQDSDSNDELNTKDHIQHNARNIESILYVGKIFSTRAEIKDAIDSYAINCRRTIRVTKNDLGRVHGKCANKECEWRVHAVKIKGESSFKVREFFSTHTCFESNNVKNVRSRWVAKKFIGMWKSDAKRSVEGFRNDAVDIIKCNISKDQAYRARNIALGMLKGSPDEEFQFLWDYVNEIKRSNPGSTVALGTNNTDGTYRFDRMYICIEALKQGMLSGCRPVLGVDGCHLKGPHKGVLLTAIGIDPNNNIYPVAYAVVDKENTETWIWFLTLVKMDLQIRIDFEWTIISDKQKGLINAVEEVLPMAAHRFCVRHMYTNFRNAGFKGMAFKMAMWKAARATTQTEFARRMKTLHDLDPAAAAWFNDKPPNQWSRSHFSTYGTTDMQLNNGCETFNACILKGRDLPILSMLEWIFEYLMKRQQINRDLSKKWKGPFCPRIQQIITRNNRKISSCIPVKSSDVHYQVHCLDGKQFSVDLKEGTCGCRKWDLTGIPCKHVMSAIDKQGVNVEDYVHSCYKIETYNNVYSTIIMPMNGRSEWPKSDVIPPLPPNYGRGVGRPTKTRRREPDEVIQKHKKKRKGRPSNPYKLPRAQTTIRCKKCGTAGHNARGCKNKEESSRTAQTELNLNAEIAAAKMIFGNSQPPTEDVNPSQDPNIGPSQVVDPSQIVVHEPFCAFLDKPATRQPPTMFQQFQSRGLKIIEPASFTGVNGVPKASDVTPSILKNGKKYVTLSNLAPTMKMMNAKDKKADKKKGKKKTGFV